MGLFEGKTPSERNKIIAAIVLGVLAVASLVYTFGGSLWSRGSSPLPPADDPVVRNDSDVPGVDASADTGERTAMEMTYAVTPLDYAGTRFTAGGSGRNIFAFYEPGPGDLNPPQTPIPFPTVKPSTPTPEAPFLASYVSPGNTYAGTRNLTIEVVGDRFTEAARIVFGGTALQTRFVSGQRLRAGVPVDLISRAGTISVQVITPDGEFYSYPVPMTILEPPKPDFEYIGLIARRHFNNDTAYFQDRGRSSSDPFTARLNDVVKGRFRVVSISSDEVEFEDVRLGFRHKLQMLRPDGSGSPSIPGVNTTTRDDGMNPPGIPGNIRRSTMPVNPIRRDVNRPNDEKKDDNDEDRYEIVNDNTNTSDEEPPR